MELPMAELMAGVRDDIEALAAQVGLTIMTAVMKGEAKASLESGDSRAPTAMGSSAAMSYMPGARCRWTDRGCGAKTTRKCH